MRTAEDGRGRRFVLLKDFQLWCARILPTPHPLQRDRGWATGFDVLPLFEFGGGFPARLVGRTLQASAGTPSLTVSSWPTVSLPKANGIKAPIATTTRIVPKKIVGEAV